MDLGDGVLFISLRRIAKFALYNTPQPDILFWQDGGETSKAWPRVHGPWATTSSPLLHKYHIHNLTLDSHVRPCCP